MSLPARIFRAKARKLCLFSIFLFLISSFLFLKPSFAETVQSQPQDLHNYTQRVVIEATSALSCAISGIDLIEKDQKCLGVANGKIGPVDTKGGAIGAMGSLIAMTFTPPAHTSDFVRYMAGNFGLAKPAYAQGVGFAGITPLLPLWIAFRNITYLVFVIVFVVIGFAIMLRVHIDPRTVMTIENQIPRIIVGLILVTFSFAIAGFLIDLMWVLTYLVIGVFQNIPNMPDISSAAQNIQGQNPIGVFNNLVGYQQIVTNASGGVKDIVLELLTKSFNTNTPNFWDVLTNIAAVLQNIVGALVAGIAGFLALIIISIAVLYSLFRIWFTLIQAYVFIILDIVLAPFWVVAGILPGANVGFTAWLRDIASNLLAFPATIGMFLLASAFFNAAGRDGKIFAPPLIGNANVPGAIQALISLGIILITPNILTIIKSALKAPELKNTGIGQAIGVGAGFPTNIVRGVGGTVAAGQEYILAEHGAERRTIGRALAGRIFGRG